MKHVLVACEESQAVTKEFRKLGFVAYSCDIQECSGGHPEWHILGDVLPLLNGWCSFMTQSGNLYCLPKKWDLIIAHPPCTYLSAAGNQCFSEKIYSKEQIQYRIEQREKAVDFFKSIYNANCDRIAIENPVGYMNTHFRKPDQIIHPYYFGDPFLKRTCLWLKGLPKLIETNKLPKPDPVRVVIRQNGKKHNIYFVEGISGIASKDRAKERSKTFPGIARAMAEQWGKELDNAEDKRK